MACQRCNSDRILSASAHCRDLGVFEIRGHEHEGYVPGDLGIGEDDDVSFDLCLDCGQMQGAWPLPQSKLERKANKKTKARLSDQAQRVVDHCLATNDGNVSDMLAMVMAGWLTFTTREIVEQVAEFINALTSEPRTAAMGEQLANVLEDWEHWPELEPLLHDEED